MKLTDGIRIESPNMVCDKWKWSTTLDGQTMKGRAATEVEAWRLVTDAQKFQYRSKQTQTKAG